MTRSFVALLALVLFALAPVAPVSAADITPQHRITTVTVYPGSALVTRAADVELPAGPSRVLIEGLPASINPALVTASGDGAFVIEGVEIRRMPAAQATSPRVREIQNRIDSTQEAIAQLDAELATLEATAQYLVKLGDVTRTGASRDLQEGRLKPEDMLALVASYQMQSRDLVMRQLEARQSKAVLVRDLEALRRELRELQAAGGKERVTAIVLVSATAAGHGTVRVRYGVNGATWEPSYDGRGMMDENAVQLTYAAQVRQATGEDWENVELTLSTAQPSLGASIPDLTPWYLQPQPPMRPVMYRAAPSGGYGANAPAQMAMDGEYDRAMVAEDVAPAPATVASTTISAGINASFTLAARTTVSGDNQTRKVQILSQRFPSRFVYRVIPELGERAYVVTKFVNSTDALFLPGAVTAFQGNDYVGQGRADAVAPGDTFELQLGIDPSVKVERTVIENLTDPSVSGFGPKRSRVTRRYRITITNTRRIAVNLNLYDRVPVSQNDDIKVERTRASVEPTEAREDGILRWELTLAPGERRVVEFGYKVEYPQEMIIWGL